MNGKSHYRLNTRAHSVEPENASQPFTPVTLGLIADRVRKLAPSHRDPERFHIDKSEIEADLRRLAKVVTHG